MASIFRIRLKAGQKPGAIARFLGRLLIPKPFEPGVVPRIEPAVPRAERKAKPKAIPYARIPAKPQPYDPLTIPRAIAVPKPVARPIPLIGPGKALGKRAPISAKNLAPFLQFKHGVVIETISVTSTWVAKIHLVMWGDQPALAVTFKDGFTALYPATTFRTFNAMRGAASKGGYVWAALFRDHAYISFVV